MFVCTPTTKTLSMPRCARMLQTSSPLSEITSLASSLMPIVSVWRFQGPPPLQGGWQSQPPSD